MPIEPSDIRAAVGRKQAIAFAGKTEERRALFGFYHPPKDGPWRGVGVVLQRSGLARGLGTGRTVGLRDHQLYLVTNRVERPQ